MLKAGPSPISAIHSYIFFWYINRNCQFSFGKNRQICHTKYCEVYSKIIKHCSVTLYVGLFQNNVSATKYSLVLHVQLDRDMNIKADI